MITSLRSCRCLSRRHLARISIIDMFGESSMNSGASETSPIRRASRVQSSSVSLPERMWCSGTRASADSSRMVISLRLISREKIAVASLCLIDADRAKSSASVELCVGTIARPARYRCRRCRPRRSGPARCATRRTSTMYRQPTSRHGRARRSLCTSCLRSSRKTSSSAQKVDGTQLASCGRDRSRDALVAEADHELAHVAGEPRGVTASCTHAARRHRAVGVEQPGEQRAPLRLRARR